MQLLDLGFIRPSDSEMASPVVCILKGRKGEMVLICVAINAICVVEGEKDGRFQRQ